MADKMRIKKIPVKIFLIPFLGLILFVVIKSSLLNIDNVKVESTGVNCVSNSSLEDFLNLSGKSIIFINEKNIINEIKNKYHCIRRVEITRQFPKNILIRLEGRVALAKITKSDIDLSLQYLESTPASSTALINWSFANPNNDIFLVDEEGVVFGVSQNENLPLLFWSDDIKIGSLLDENIFPKISTIFVKLPTMDLSNLGASGSSTLAFQAKVDNDHLLIKTGGHLIFSLQKEISRQLASLQLILQKAKIDGRVMETIDLRFDKPVVVYLPKKK